MANLGEVANKLVQAAKNLDTAASAVPPDRQNVRNALLQVATTFGQAANDFIQAAKDTAQDVKDRAQNADALDNAGKAFGVASAWSAPGLGEAATALTTAAEDWKQADTAQTRAAALTKVATALTQVETASWSANEDFRKIIREMIQNENILMDHRRSHFATLQGFLWTATALLASSGNRDLVYIVASAGAVLAFVAALSMPLSHMAIGRLTGCVADPYHPTPVIGLNCVNRINCFNCVENQDAATNAQANRDCFSAFLDALFNRHEFFAFFNRGPVGPSIIFIFWVVFMIVLDQNGLRCPANSFICYDD